LTCLLCCAAVRAWHGMSALLVVRAAILEQVAAAYTEQGDVVAAM